MKKTLYILLIFIVLAYHSSNTNAAQSKLLTLNSEAFEYQNINSKKQIKTIKNKVRSGNNFPIDIPDNSPEGVNLTFNANSFTGTLDTLTLELEIEHTFVGDLSATLTAPNGIAQLVIFSRVGRAPGRNIGYGSNLNGTYTFNDQATQDIWTTAADNDATVKSTLPVGLYRTSTQGTDLSNFGGCTTRLNGAFKGLTAEQANGDWIFNISDNELGDAGRVVSVGFVTDQDNSNVESIFKSGFEVEYAPLQFLPASDILGDCKKAQFDFSGNGLSDYNLAYESIDQEFIFQFSQNTGNGMSNEAGTVLLSPIALNPVLTSGGDYDGDGITDVVVRVDNSAGGYDYLIRRSSRPNDLWIRQSTSTDFYDPQFGDYDGDGLDDLAWFSALESTAANSLLFIFNSSDFSQRQLATGIGMRSDFRAAGGFDHTGDGIADLFLMVDDGLGSGNQIGKIFNGVDGNPLLDSVDAIWNPRVRQLPGNFMENGTAGAGTFVIDLPGEDNYSFVIYDDTISSFAEIRFLRFGNDPTDTPITGDYDGDGIDDFGVWRPDTDGLGARFIISPSSSADPDNNLIVVAPADATVIDIPISSVRVR